MRVLVCVKRVPAPGARIVLTPDGQQLDTKNLGFATSPHEECAVEGAVQLAADHGGSSTVLAMGPPESEEQLRYAVSVGVDNAVLVPTDGSDLDPQATAWGLVGAISELEERDGRFDLILFGNESADAGGYQVGVRVARALERPIVSGIKDIEMDGDQIVAKREIPSGFEVYRLGLPAVLAVREGLNLPRYPTLPGRLKSRKAEVGSVEVPIDPGGQHKVGFESPPEQESHTVMLGEGAEAVPAIVEVLETLGIR
jgi:electron transfer flavoprotein beta subunit